MPGWVTHVEYAWEEPSYARFLQRLASFARVITFDKRGTGLSDRDTGLPTLEERMDDVRSVMDAVGSQRAAILGMSEGGNMCALFAATYPERTVALIVFSIFAKRIWSPDYPWAPTPEAREEWFKLIERDWGGVVDLSTLCPSRAADPAFAEWWSTYLRLGASPSAALALGRTNTQIDIRAVLPAIRVPTLVLHRRGDRDAKIEEGRYIA
ncbi:MAG: alpha/beta fold hydrolase, partial [Dongiaceae bacterium]